MIKTNQKKIKLQMKKKRDNSRDLFNLCFNKIRNKQIMMMKIIIKMLIINLIKAHRCINNFKVNNQQVV